MKAGRRNLITDVAGLRVGHADDAALRSGTTVLTADSPFEASVHVMGGAPGTRDTELLAPDKLVREIDAIFLSGGSAFGLAAGDGVMAGLRAEGRGFAVGDVRVPIVPGAIIFDLMNGGRKDWDQNPYPGLGRAALESAAADFPIGTAGAGTGAMTGKLKGGIGSASAVLDCGVTVGALVVVNALGSATVAEGRHFWAAPWELNGEFGGLGPAPHHDPGQEPLPAKQLGEATTIAIVATDASLTKSGLQRLATAAHDGMSRALVPSHTPYDGDLVFAVSTGATALPDPAVTPFQLGHAAAATLARAIARAVYAASPREGDLQRCWSDLEK
ncbi:P1 family peptidase [Paracoccus aurantiacus]|uniref:P1 family peptidase n=1 Tax=Paracoccus aurantiacus TaxID=2599412 RepID=A0A5C6S235_9RHOB|nr:P1 family peptidase [Paracoccus aurantiacus]TXB68518.1 P1 family peptidase [Paracoccus aurantiacus]